MFFIIYDKMERFIVLFMLFLFLTIPNAILLRSNEGALRQEFIVCMVSVACGIALAHVKIVTSQTSNIPESKLVQHIRSFVLPYVVVDVIPSTLIIVFNIISSSVMLMIAIPLWIAGLTLMFLSIDMFANIGHGTLAPFDPPTTFVCKGVYQHTRNPMITGVLFLLASQAFMYKSWILFGWTMLFFLAKTLYFVFEEEPELLSRFGASYAEYKRNVPRWIPRVTPFVPSPTK